ncbi:transcriptional regulator [Aeromicrobium sp. A1-2]|nr:transcriptional regulator [Aeromicrobium sp. A1-2]
MHQSELDGVIFALANSHRREMVRVLGLQPCTISQLAKMRDLSLPAMHKHVAVLEQSGLVSRRKVGRTNTLTLDASGLRGLQDWLGQFHTWWGADGASLENYQLHLDSTGPGTPQ